MIQPDTFIYALDLLGCAVCAASGAMQAKRVGFDFLGGIMIAVVTALGGGICRDLLINRHPLFWLHNMAYLWLITVSALMVRVFYYFVERHFYRPLRLFDAAGLAVFAVIGFEAALSKNLPYPIVVLMGVMTAVLGGILRDIVCGQLPLVLQKEIYISCAVFGGLLYLGLMHYSISLWLRDLITIATIFSLRMLVIYRGWNLPDITLPDKPR